MQTTLFDPPKPIAKTLGGLTPRPYQVEDVAESFRLWESGSVGTLSRLATGLGKTLAACLKFERWLETGGKCLVISYEKQLVWQFAQEIEDYLGFSPGIEMEKEHCQHGQIPDIVVASRQTLMRHPLATVEQRDALGECGVVVGNRLVSKSNATRAIRMLRDGEIELHTVEDEIDQFQEHWMCDHESGTISRLHKFDPSDDWLVCFDEAHKYTRGMITVGHIVEWFERNRRHRRFGLTATPRRSDGVAIEGLFPGVSVDMSLAAAVKQGWAVGFEQRFIRIESIDFADIRRIAGESQARQDAEVAKRLEMQLAKLCVPLIEQTGELRTLAFFPSVELVKQAVAFVNARKPGSAVGVWGELQPSERQKIYQQHKAGKVQYLFACGLCRESYNDQQIMCVAIFRMVSKKAISLAEQMKGRGGRVLPGTVDGLNTSEERIAAIAASAKPHCVIIDLVGAGSLSECATTVQIYAEGEPDELVARAEEIALDGGLPPDEAIEQARDEIEEERRIEKAKREEEEARQREIEAWRRKQAGVEVEYSVHKRGAQIDTGRRGGKPLSEKMINFLRWKKLTDDQIGELSFQQAMRVIGQFKAGKSLEQVIDLNRLGPKEKPVETVAGERYVMPDAQEMFELFRS